MCMQAILDSLFARPGSAPIWGGKKGEFRDWTSSKLERRKIEICKKGGYSTHFHDKVRCRSCVSRSFHYDFKTILV